jgi:hypothetical protein
VSARPAERRCRIVDDLAHRPEVHGRVRRRFGPVSWLSRSDAQFAHGDTVNDEVRCFRQLLDANVHEPGPRELVEDVARCGNVLDG